MIHWATVKVSTFGRLSWYWFRETRHSELLVVFCENLVALLGLTFALIALSATIITGNSLYDALGSITIDVLWIVIAILVGMGKLKYCWLVRGLNPK